MAGLDTETAVHVFAISLSLSFQLSFSVGYWKTNMQLNYPHANTRARIAKNQLLCRVYTSNGRILEAPSNKAHLVSLLPDASCRASQTEAKSRPGARQQRTWNPDRLALNQHCQLEHLCEDCEARDSHASYAAGSPSCPKQQCMPLGQGWLLPAAGLVTGRPWVRKSCTRDSIDHSWARGRLKQRRRHQEKGLCPVETRWVRGRRGRRSRKEAMEGGGCFLPFPLPAPRLLPVFSRKELNQADAPRRRSRKSRAVSRRTRFTGLNFSKVGSSGWSGSIPECNESAATFSPRCTSLPISRHSYSRKGPVES